MNTTVSPRERAVRRRTYAVSLFLLLLIVMVTIGCAPRHYIYKADSDALSLINSQRRNPKWSVSDYRFYPDKDSRLAMNYCQETPPRPCDDPASNAFMRCVDGKRGWNGWNKYGVETQIDTGKWLSAMEYNDDGKVVIDRAKAMELALKNSRDYQSARETLYLTALTVSYERFGFDVQYFADASGSGTFRDPGDESASVGVGGSIEKATAIGGQLVVDLANSIVWTFGSGTTSHLSSTLMGYSISQPLLRGAGRAVALEGLTQSERNLLACVRSMERYRQGFYMSTIAGMGGASVSSSASISIDTVSAGSAGGFLGLLKTQLQLINQRSNVDSLQDSLNRMEASEQANRISSYQVDQTRQSLYDSQLNLLQLKNNYNNSVDQFKINIGLPPELPVEIKDPLLNSFEMISADLNKLQKLTEKSLVDVRSTALAGQDLQDRLVYLQQDTERQIKVVEDDIAKLNKLAPRRRADLKAWAAHKDKWGDDFDAAIFDIQKFNTRLVAIEKDAQRLFKELGMCAEMLTSSTATSVRSGSGSLEDSLYRLNTLLLELILIQGRTRLDSVSLIPIDMDPECAIRVAETNRLDWMNARAALVDQWRQIEIAKNALKANLTVTSSGQINMTDANHDGGSVTQNMNVGVQFDAPLTRMSERNAYRRALISYYSAHRNFMAQEDRVRQNIREILRKINLSQMSFELQRASVLVAMSQYDQRRLQLDRPPKPNETSSFGDSFARDLIDALTSLLNNQNSIMSDWLDYEVLRMSLDYALGTMKIDEHGMWIDPGDMSSICPVATKSIATDETDDVLPAAEPHISSQERIRQIEEQVRSHSTGTLPTAPAQPADAPTPITPAGNALEQAVPGLKLPEVTEPGVQLPPAEAIPAEAIPAGTVPAPVIPSLDNNNLLPNIPASGPIPAPVLPPVTDSRTNPGGKVVPVQFQQINSTTSRKPNPNRQLNYTKNVLGWD